MSQYLVDALGRIDNVDVRTGADVVGVDGDERLRTVSVSPTSGGVRDELRADAMFICIGGVPHTEGTERLPLRRDLHGYLITGTDSDDEGSPGERWPLTRPPFPLETNLPGLFAAGDVRHGSTKRCATAVGEGAMAVALVHLHLADVPAA
jgi:thioredoxin reductase (NADPH)